MSNSDVSWYDKLLEGVKTAIGNGVLGPISGQIFGVGTGALQSGPALYGIVGSEIRKHRTIAEILDGGNPLSSPPPQQQPPDGVSSPIILDLNGDGVKTVGFETGVHFDHDGNRFAELSGWVDKNDGLLVWDRNGNGQIDDGGELFGDNTLLSNGQKTANGFQALSAT